MKNDQARLRLALTAHDRALLRHLIDAEQRRRMAVDEAHSASVRAAAYRRKTAAAA